MKNRGGRKDREMVQALSCQKVPYSREDPPVLPGKGGEGGMKEKSHPLMREVLSTGGFRYVSENLLI